jgi:hypothetical protein
MRSNSDLYGKWRKRLAPDNCESRLTNMVYLVVGLFKARSVHLSLIARKLPVQAKKLSLDKRLRHFLSTPAVRVREWYQPVLAATGEHVIHTNQAGDVDRTDRRDLSVFRIGWDFIERRLALDVSLPPVFIPNFCSVSGG